MTLDLTRRREDRQTPFRALVWGYAAVTALGAALLTLPMASTTGAPQSTVDALFMAASGISTTGLAVVDLGTRYTLFGQIVMLVIFQIGGIGYMTMIVPVASALGLRLSFNTALAARESLAGNSINRLRRFLVFVLFFSLVCEGLGAIPLIACWSEQFSMPRAIYLGIFHSVSAFCTAGFALFPDSLMSYRDHLTINATIIVVSLLGGLGFVVIMDVIKNTWRTLLRRHPHGLSLHAKMTLAVTGSLVAAGTLGILVGDRGPAAFSSRALSALFQAVSASTTDGFNTVDIGTMVPASLTVIMVLMFVGASPGSTGGGIKTTTFGTMVLYIRHILMGRKGQIVCFRRAIETDAAIRALAIALAFVVVIVADTLILTMTESAGFLQIVFEIVSALGNTGLSTGITPTLSTIGKLVLSLTMFVGRIGPFALCMALTDPTHELRCVYGAEEIYIG